MKIKKKYHYDLNCIDNKTKFITAHLLVGKRTKNKCVEFLKQVKDICLNQILAKYYLKKFTRVDKRIVFVCDGFKNYKSSFNKLLYRIAKLQFGVPIARKKYGLEHNNNPIERYNGKIKDRIKIMRGGFGSFGRAEAFMNLRRVINNFVNPHQSLQGKTPAEMAEIKLELGRNKLLGLIRYVAEEKHHFPG